MATLKTVLLCVFVWLASAFLTAAAFVTVSSLPGSERRQQVAFSEFLAEVDQGKVDEIRVSGRVATFRRVEDGKHSRELETVGPLDDRAQVLALRPSRPDSPAPKITFER
jgi:hypothetical protein